MPNLSDERHIPTLVVNLYGGPGTGKSTTAAGVFNALKNHLINAELITEYAKDKVWEHSGAVLGNQLYVFAKQHHRLWRVLDQVSVAVTDSPLLLSRYYGKAMGPVFMQLVFDEYLKMRNLDIFLKRIKPYQPIGRRQNEESAKAIDVEVRKMLESLAVSYYETAADEFAVDEIVEVIERQLLK